MAKTITAPQVKVCGLTRPDEAKICATLGADAIGLIFYPPSPRNLSMAQAAAITAVLPSHVTAVGVFVDPAWPMLVEVIDRCRLSAVQLHGNEPPELVARLLKTYDIKVFKALFTAKPPDLRDAGAYAASAYLVECGQGRLPGGNAIAWDWSAAFDFAQTHGTILAGGLTPDNVAQAIGACLPDAVDASSGLETDPGRKDLSKVALFLANVRRTTDLYRAPQKALQKIF